MKSITSQVLHAAPGRLLFNSHIEAAALWRALSTVPGVVELVLMPDHVHLLLPPASLRRLGPRMSGYARWRNARRREHGPVFQARGAPSPVSDESHLRRARRYFALNPRRKQLAHCPLEWPWSTHRDRLGLAWTLVGRPHRQAEWWHQYVSTDHESGAEPTALPAARADLLSVDEVLEAYSSLARVPMDRLGRKSSDRAAVVRLVGALCAGTSREQAARLGVASSIVVRATPPPKRAEALVRAVAGDLRFGGLQSAALGWPAYRHKH